MKTAAPPMNIEQQLREMNDALLVSSVHQHELTEQAEQAHETQRESHARFAALFDASPIGMYLVDAELRIRLMSRNARSVFGDVWEGGGELIGSDFVEVVHILWPPESADDIVDRFRHTLETGQPYVAPEFSEERYDRKVREYYDWQIHRISLPDGKHGVVCYFIDISERVLAKRSLGESEMRYRRLFEAAQGGILILDAQTRKVTDANPFMSNLLGYSHVDFLGKELWEIGLFSDKSASEAAVRLLKEQGYVRYENLPLESDHGRRIEVEIVANVYREDNRDVIQCNIRDITERSRLEKHAHEQADQLSQASRHKDEFLATLAHELRNPLAPIAHAVQLLLRQKDEDQVQQQARTIIARQVGQLTRLIDDMLEVSRITTGTIHLQAEPVTFGSIVDNAVETVRPLIGQRRHALKVSLPPQPIWLHADGARLEQVVVNLLNNAAKYTPDGGHILLALEQEGEEAVLRVRDTGVGISAELMPHVFDLFTQAQRSLDRSQGGLGIGLSLVRRLVEMHRGHVKAYSTLGEGSEFVVRLPVAPAPTPAPLPPTELTKPTEQRLRVLTVDDNVDGAHILGMLLTASGHEVRTAHNGLEALQVALDFCPDLVLMDIGLPGMNGLEVAKLLRSRPDFDNVVLVAVTGYGQDSDRQRSQEAGFDHHLVKPADYEKLQQILATIEAK